MQENDLDQSTALSQFLRESYQARTHKHNGMGCPDCPCCDLHGKMDDSVTQEGPLPPDLSAFLSQEELNKSVDLAQKSIGHEPQEQEDKSGHCLQINSYRAHNIKTSPDRVKVLPERQVVLSSSKQDNTIRNISSREAVSDMKKNGRNTPYGVETQSKKEFLNKAADFIEELSSLFKANSSKRIRPRACKAHRSRYQSKHQFDAATFAHEAEGTKLPVLPNDPLEFQLEKKQDTEEPQNTERGEQEHMCKMECKVPVLMEPESSDPVYEPPHFVQKLKSREVPEGSKVKLDCIVRGFPVPEVRWFCEGKELENSPDIQIINNGELHSLIIAEAFEEDTGRYSCFASNFYGTDSTSAEIYVEGASSSDSDGEQHLVPQLHKRASQPIVTMVPLVPFTPPKVEDYKIALMSSSLNQTTPSETTTIPSNIASTVAAEEIDSKPVQVNSSQIPIMEPSLAPPSQMISTVPTAQSVSAPLDALSQEMSSLLSTGQQNFIENQNSFTYPQDFEGRSIMAAPVFTKNLQDLLALEGELIVLECRVKGVPSPRVDWYREGTLVEDSPDFRILQKKPRSMADSEEICTLVIAEVFPEDSGTFTCTASNKYGTVSTVAVLNVEGNDNRNQGQILSSSTVEVPQHKTYEEDLITTSKYPLASCLKNRSDRVLENNSDPRSSSRVGLRVTFKLPEDEDEKSKSHDTTLSNKEPPPVLAKPKLNQLQLKILHNQVLLEQQQESTPEDPEESHQKQSDGASCEPPCNKHPVLPLNPATANLKPFSNIGSMPQMSSLLDPLMNTTSVQMFNQTNSSLLTEINPSPTIMLSNSLTSQNTTLCSQFNSIPIKHDPSIKTPEMIIAPTATTPLSQFTTTSMSLPSPNTGSTSALPQLSVVPTMHQTISLIDPINLSHTPFSPPLSQLTLASMSQARVPLTEVGMAIDTKNSLNESPKKLMNTTENKVTSTSINQNSTDPTLMQNTNSQNAISELYDTTSLHQLKNTPAPVLSVPASIVQTQTPCINSISGTNSMQSFNFTRPKEFIIAHTLSPVRSPSPTVSPVPILQELPTQLFPIPSRDLTSPINQFFPSPRVFPTRLVKSPSSPPYVSSPPLMLPTLVNRVIALPPQSPPQASSPTSSTSTPSPIQNPVAFLSSVLPSLPTSPPTNAMGLPMRAPSGPQATLKTNLRGSRTTSIEDIHDSRQSALYNNEKEFLPRYVQQEYKVSNFEQRLMSEIEFRLERTPVEESDDEIQHDEIPTGKCIAPLFDKKLKNFRVIEGLPVTFTCKVVGVPIPKVYWFKDGKQILKNKVHYERIREGDGTCCLHIEAATNDDDGNYTVMAANPQGRISCSGHLIVQSNLMRNRPIDHPQRVRARVKQVEDGECSQERFFRPHFLQAPGDMVYHEGRLCRLDCKVSGLPQPETIWLLNGKPVRPDLTHRVLVRENGIHSLVIDPLTKDDAGTYTCIASNKAGQSSFCLELSVVEKEKKQAPQFLEKLKNTGIAEGNSVRLECRVVGMPPPVIYWKKDNDTICNPKGRFSLHQDPTGYVCLLIQPTKKEDAGWYTVSAKNEAGVISCTARLDIYAQWHQQFHPLIQKASLTGNHYAALSGEGLDMKSVFLTTDNCPSIFSTSHEESTIESEEL